MAIPRKALMNAVKMQMSRETVLLETGNSLQDHARERLRPPAKLGPIPDLRVFE